MYSQILARLTVSSAFDPLTSREKLYAHRMARYVYFIHHLQIYNDLIPFRAARHGSRIILRQLSLESMPIFGFIMGVYHSCKGRWEDLAAVVRIPLDGMDAFLQYAAVFLGNIGIYHVQTALEPFTVLLTAKLNNDRDGEIKNLALTSPKKH